MMSLITAISLLTLTFHGRQTNGTGGVWLNTCTAVYVAPHQALTAAHCIEKVVDEKMWVRTDDGKSYKASLLRINTMKDLALIEIAGPPHAFARLANKVTKGEPVYLVSSELDMIGTYGEGIVANVIIDAQLHNTPMIVHTAVIKPGASGSGLFNRNGELIGINTIAMGALSEAVDLFCVRQFLESYTHIVELTPK